MAYIPDELPTYDQAQAQALTNPSYTEGAGLLDTQQQQEQNQLTTQRTGVVQSYAQSRQSAINSYQDALDQINYGMRQVGIQTQAGSAQRGLYNASGELSGIGQGVAAMNIEPLVRQSRTLGERQAQTMANLTTQEQQAISQVDQAISALPTKYQQNKAALRDKIIQSILDTAEQNRKSNMDVAKFNLDITQEERMQRTANTSIPGTPEYRQKIKVEQQEKGRTHLIDNAAVKKAEKAGRNIITINGMKFALSAEEELDLRKKRADISKVLSGDGDGSKTYTGTFTNANGEVIRYIVDAKGNVKNLKVGDTGVVKKDPNLESDAKYNFYGEAIQSGALSLEEVSKLVQTGKLDADVYNDIKANVDAGLIINPKGKPWWQSDLVQGISKVGSKLRTK